MIVLVMLQLCYDYFTVTFVALLKLYFDCVKAKLQHCFICYSFVSAVFMAMLSTMIMDMFMILLWLFYSYAYVCVKAVFWL